MVLYFWGRLAPGAGASALGLCAQHLTGTGVSPRPPWRPRTGPLANGAPPGARPRRRALAWEPQTPSGARRAHVTGFLRVLRLRVRLSPRETDPRPRAERDALSPGRALTWAALRTGIPRLRPGLLGTDTGRQRSPPTSQPRKLRPGRGRGRGRRLRRRGRKPGRAAGGAGSRPLPRRGRMGPPRGGCAGPRLPEIPSSGAPPPVLDKGQGLLGQVV